jgi:hypothetical protein
MVWPEHENQVGRVAQDPVPEIDGWFAKSVGRSEYMDVDGSTCALYSIWYPLYDTPVTIRTSRETLQALADELRGVNVYPGWAEHMAKRLDAVLRRSLVEEPADAPRGDS